MSEEAGHTVSVRILDKQYRVSCPPGEEQSLHESARYLDDKMREIRNAGKIIGLERMAVMAALNIAHELLDASRQLEAADDDGRAQIQRLTAKIGRVLEADGEAGRTSRETLGQG